MAVLDGDAHKKDPVEPDKWRGGFWNTTNLFKARIMPCISYESPLDTADSRRWQDGWIGGNGDEIFRNGLRVFGSTLEGGKRETALLFTGGSGPETDEALAFTGGNSRWTDDGSVERKSEKSQGTREYYLRTVESHVPCA